MALSIAIFLIPRPVVMTMLSFGVAQGEPLRPRPKTSQTNFLRKTVRKEMVDCSIRHRFYVASLAEFIYPLWRISWAFSPVDLLKISRIQM